MNRNISLRLANGLSASDCTCFICPFNTLGASCLYRPPTPLTKGEGALIDFSELEKAITLAVRFLDDVIDVTPYFHLNASVRCVDTTPSCGRLVEALTPRVQPLSPSEIEKCQKEERRIGLGTMGLAEALIRLGLRYGSNESLEFIDKLYGFIAKSAYLASVELAKEKGRFPAYDEQFLKSGFMMNMPKEVRDEVSKHGIRNMTILTQAPTGSIATMVGTSTGIEPFFDFRYTRKSQLGVDYEYVKVYAEWKEAHPTGVSKNADDNDEALPDYFVTTKDITVEEHVAVQSAVQRWVDASISKTVNLPSEATKDDVSNVFKKLYQSGCKGGTVYRGGSRKEQVLQRIDDCRLSGGDASGADASNRRRLLLRTTPSADDCGKTPHGIVDCRLLIDDRKDSSNNQQSSIINQKTIINLKSKIKDLPYKRLGATVSMKTPSGTAHITMNHDCEGQPFEVFVEIGKAGSSVKAMAEAIGRLISLIFRLTSISPMERAKEIIEQLNGIGGAHSVGFGKNKVLSLPDAISKAMAEHYGLTENPLNGYGTGEAEKAYVGEAQTPSYNADICPVCGQESYVLQEGCNHCRACGHSEC